MKPAFQCRTCGGFEDSGNAGERAVPASCRWCGSGVGFDPKTGIKTYHDGNWIVLADLTKAELKKLDLEPDDIEQHTPATPAAADREPRNIERTAEETLGAEDVAE